MKNSKHYSPKVETLLKTLKKKAAPVTPPSYDDPVEAVVYACISAYTTEANAQAIHRRIGTHFVDMNDLRVSRPEEIKELYGEPSPGTESATLLRRILNAIFDKYDKVSLNELTAEGKRQARKELDEIPGMTPFVAAYTFLTALGGHAIPLTDRMIAYLLQHEMIHPKSTQHEIESFLERHIHAVDAYTFYALLRAETEGGIKPARATAAKKSAKKKTVKKKTPKK